MPFVRVVAGDPERISWTIAGGTAQIRVAPPESTGELYFELMLGHLVQPESDSTRGAGIFNVELVDLDVLDDEDPGSVGDTRERRSRSPPPPATSGPRPTASPCRPSTWTGARTTTSTAAG